MDYKWRTYSYPLRTFIKSEMTDEEKQLELKLRAVVNSQYKKMSYTIMKEKLEKSVFLTGACS